MAPSLEHYEQKLGFRPAAELAEVRYAIVERDGIAVHLFVGEFRRCSPVAVHIFTPDLEELHTELQGRGALIAQQIRKHPWGNRDFRVKDPSGNDIKFTEPLPAG